MSPSLATSFQSCSFAAVPLAKKIDPTEEDDGTNCITSFFLDSSGRSSFTLPLEMTFSSQKDLDEFLEAKCFDPPLRNSISDVDLGSGENDGSSDKEAKLPSTSKESAVSSSRSFLSFEVTTLPIDERDKHEVAIEGVSILSSTIKGLIVTFKTEMTVRASLNDDSLPSGSQKAGAQTSATRFSSSPRRSSSSLRSSTVGSEPESDEGLQANISTRLEITPVLTIENSGIRSGKGSGVTGRNSNTLDFSPDLMALELAAIPDHMQYNNKNKNKAAPGILSSADDSIHEARLSSVSVNLTLTNAFTTVVNSVPGPNSPTGNTLVSLTIRHSETHNLPVTITNIAFHPGHSRHSVVMSTNDKNKNAPLKVQQVLANMTESVEWGFAPMMEVELPLTLLPHDAYSTILFVNAGEERSSRQFISPLSVTGVIDTNANIRQTNEEEKEGYDDSERCRVVVAGDAYWTTKLISVEPADAFRIDMCTVEPTARRGQPIVVKLRIFNLSLESRSLMMFMPPQKDTNLSIQNKALAIKHESVNAAVVSESDGYTFGVWGISGEDDGTVRLNKDNDLLAIDTALVLGEVQGQHAVDTELRFVPLHLGRLKIPDWRLYDKGAKRWYTCNHDLSIIAV